MRSRPASWSRTAARSSTPPSRSCLPPRRPRTKGASDVDRPGHRSDHLRARAACRHRGHRQGARHPAHAADVGRQLDPRDRAGRGDADRRHGAHRGRVRARVRGLVLRRRQRRRRVRGDRPDAEDVPAEDAAGRARGGRGRRRRRRAIAGNGATAGRGRGRVQPPAVGDARMDTFTTNIQLVYVLAAACFVVGLHLMNSPATARRGNQVSTAGMAIAVIITLVLLIHDGSVTGVGWTGLIVGALLGSVAGLYSARTVQMTAMPQLVSMFNAVGGGAAALVAVYEYIHDESTAGGVLGSTSVFTVLDVIIGSVTFTGSLIAAGKLQGVITGNPIVFKGGQALNIALAVVALGTGAFMLTTASLPALLIVVLASLAFGVMMVLPIGGADMPVVISLLNAFTGTAVAMAGFVVGNWALIVAGALVGASGGILTKLMADAMNRSLANIII